MWGFAQFVLLSIEAEKAWNLSPEGNPSVRFPFLSSGYPLAFRDRFAPLKTQKIPKGASESECTDFPRGETLGWGRSRMLDE